MDIADRAACIELGVAYRAGVAQLEHSRAARRRIQKWVLDIKRTLDISSSSGGDTSFVHIDRMSGAGHRLTALARWSSFYRKQDMRTRTLLETITHTVQIRGGAFQNRTIINALQVSTEMLKRLNAGVSVEDVDTALDSFNEAASATRETSDLLSEAMTSDLDTDELEITQELQKLMGGVSITSDMTPLPSIRTVIEAPMAASETPRTMLIGGDAAVAIASASASPSAFCIEEWPIAPISDDHTSERESVTRRLVSPSPSPPTRRVAVASEVL